MSPVGSILVNPSVLLVNQTDNVTFTCGAMGGPGNSFQWSHNGQDLSGEITSTLTLTNISASDDGNYTCTVSNSAGSGSDVSMLIGMYACRSTVTNLHPQTIYVGIFRLFSWGGVH